MSQTRKRSVAESLINIAVGLSLSIGLNYVILYHQGYQVKLIDMGWLGFWMTVASFCRSLTLRRFFNWYDVRFPSN